MAAFGADGRCLMRVLQEELDDPARRRTAGAARSAPGRASRSHRTRARRSWPRATCARRRSSSRSRRWRPTPPARCARSPRTCASSPGGRSRASATAAGGRRSSAGCAPATFDDDVVVGAGRTCVRRRRGTRVAWVTTVPSVRLGDVLGPAAERSARELGVPHVRARRARRGPTAPARDGQRGPAGRQRPRRVQGHRGAAAAAPACCSTTAAARAGRSRWSAASCAGREPSRSCRSRSGALG